MHPSHQSGSASAKRPAASRSIRAAVASRGIGVPANLLIRQRRVAADWSEIRRFLESFPGELARSPFTVCLVSDPAMRRYNETFRHKAGATDVLSFPAEGTFRDAGRESYAGDVLISVDSARRNARLHGLRLEDEIKALILHGVLHLLGYDHESDRGRMARAEKRWGARLRLPQTLLARSPAAFAKPRAAQPSAGGGPRGVGRRAAGKRLR